ncbi:hypothetical protein QTO34_005493 [Cnephaeus nilssonii]|uniref:Uncharacterized protein n=1 Tax=Cnephaeus nilssonii TaxID=3371016 RepID=A0AA40LJF3_CNENI|nr:hypothetical protein QTO34_005493 [Eptesicus nilssonii]
MRPNAHGNHSWPESLEPEEAEPKAPAQEAEEAPAETPEVQTEKSDEESMKSWRRGHLQRSIHLHQCLR